MGRTISKSVSAAVRYHEEKWDACLKCKIGKLANTHCLFRGTVPCQVLFIGEGPGKTEDLYGEPFVGVAGQLLDRWIEVAMQFRHFTYALTNLVACRPTSKKGGPNRQPSPDEIANCASRLSAFVTYIARPDVVVKVGRCADSNFVSAMPSLHLIHPAFVLRQGGCVSRWSHKATSDLVSFLQKEQVI